MTLPVVVILALALAPRNTGSGTVAIQRPPSEPACAALMSSLPDALVGLARREVRPSDDQVRAWGDPALVLRCGVSRPAALVPASDATVFYIKDKAVGDGVLWLPDANHEAGAGPTAFTAVDRDVYVEVLIPSGQNVVPLPQISDLISAAFPDPVCLGQTTGVGPVIPDDQLCSHRQ
ncbi:MAG: DUF3515 domain-containing protein [Frankiaceae bacterium]|nr:DUF3515 domain-containing protein [Frankiaceae bacterium]